MVLAICILVFAFLVTWHFVYESIVVPSYRLQLRFELFALRDELRFLKIVHGEEFDDEAFNVLHTAMNSLISRLHAINIRTLYLASQALEQQEWKERVAKSRHAIGECKIDRVKEIDSECFSAFRRVFIANSGGWAAYVVPIAILAAGLRKVAAAIRSLVYISDRERDKIIPPSAAANA